MINRRIEKKEARQRVMRLWTKTQLSITMRRQVQIPSSPVVVSLALKEIFKDQQLVIVIRDPLMMAHP